MMNIDELEKLSVEVLDVTNNKKSTGLGYKTKEGLDIYDQSVKCLNRKCKHAQTCHRYKGNPKRYGQMYMINTVFDENGNCDHFIQLRPRKKGGLNNLHY